MGKLCLVSEFPLAKHFYIVSCLKNCLCLLWLQHLTTSALILKKDLLDKVTIVWILHIRLLVEVFLFSKCIVMVRILHTLLVIFRMVLHPLMIVFNLSLVEKCKMVWAVIGQVPTEAFESLTSCIYLREILLLQM